MEPPGSGVSVGRPGEGSGVEPPGAGGSGWTGRVKSSGRIASVSVWDSAVRNRPAGTLASLRWRGGAIRFEISVSYLSIHPANSESTDLLTHVVSLLVRILCSRRNIRRIAKRLGHVVGSGKLTGSGCRLSDADRVTLDGSCTPADSVDGMTCLSATSVPADPGGTGAWLGTGGCFPSEAT